jgi:hypothetical protein
MLRMGTPLLSGEQLSRSNTGRNEIESCEVPLSVEKMSATLIASVAERCYSWEASRLRRVTYSSRTIRSKVMRLPWM